MDFFKNTKIRVQDLLGSISSFTQNVYKQSKTVYTPASPWGQIMLVFSKITQMILYYIEDSITELNINTSTRSNSVYGLARLTGHNATRAVGALGDLVIIYNNSVVDIPGQNVIIPNFTKVKCKNNNLTYTTILGQDEIKVNLYQMNKSYLRVIQGYIESQQFTGTGNQLQSYECNIMEGRFIDNEFVNVFVNGEKWKKFESLYDMSYGEKGCIVKTGITTGIDVYFGTNNMGLPPDLGATILVEYLVTDGNLGNLNSQSDLIFEFQDVGYDENGNEVDLNSIFQIGMATPISFGSDPEATELTRILAPGTSRSFVLATTENYVNFFRKFQMFSYIDVYTQYDIYDPKIDNFIYVMLVPDIKKRFRSGENYFTVPLDYFRLTELEKYRLQAYIDESGGAILGSVVEFVDASFKRFAVNIYLNVFVGFNKDNIKNNIVSKLSDYFSTFRRTDYLPQSDLIALIESVDGVDSVNLNFVSEDIENSLKILFDDNAILTYEDSNIAYSIYDEMVLKSPAGTNLLSIEEKQNIIFSNSDFQDYMRKIIDDNGDIVLGKNEMPLIRGGFYDRYQKFYNDGIISDSLSSINIFILKENKKGI